MKHRFLIFLLFLPFTLPGQAIDSLAFTRLTEAISRLQASELMRHGTLGISLRDRESGEALVALNDEKSLPPASTVKLAATAAALEILGESFSFETHLEYDGTLSDGVLKGNLYIRGTGDPTLGSPRFKDKADSASVFKEWLAAIKRAGIRQINGKVYADVAYFGTPGIAGSWLWGDIGHGYAAGVYGLNWNENISRLYFRSGSRTGAPATLLRVEPEIRGIRYLSQVETGPPGSGDKTRITPSDYAGTFLIDGTIPRVRGEFNIKGSVFNPGLLVAGYFKKFLGSHQVPVSGGAEVWIPQGSTKPRTLIHTYKSPPLPEICKQINWWSVNIYADAVLKTMAYKLTGKTDFRSAAEALTGFWALKGVQVSGMHLKDGSGLSGTALLTPRNLSDILNTAAQFGTFPLFYETIAIAGESGTVRSRRFGNRSNIRAKSGSIGGTRAYAGYINTSTGQRLSFVVNANRYLPDSSTQVVRELMEIVKLMGEL